MSYAAVETLPDGLYLLVKVADGKLSPVAQLPSDKVMNILEEANQVVAEASASMQPELIPEPVEEELDGQERIDEFEGVLPSEEEGWLPLRQYCEERGYSYNAVSLFARTKANSETAIKYNGKWYVKHDLPYQSREDKCRRIICVETGRVFNSAKDAAMFAGVSADAVRSAIYNGNRTNGYHVRYVN